MNSECFNILIKDELFLSFLKHQIQGVFNNFDCDHIGSDDICLQCVIDFIKGSEFKNYFEGLYNWFKEVNFQPCIRNEYFYFNSYNRASNQINNHIENDQVKNDQRNINWSDVSFYPQDIFKCFNLLCYYLKSNEARYFCSSWLDGILSQYKFYFTNDKKYLENCDITLFDIFKQLCVEEHFETLQWFYWGIRPYFRLSKTEQQQIFYNMYYRQTKKNTKIHEILSWLFSLKIFDKVDGHHKYGEAFDAACTFGNLELIKWLLNLKDKNEINVHAGHESGFRRACQNGHTEVVKLLLNLKGQRQININTVKEDGFKLTCKNRHIEVVNLLFNYLDKHQDFVSLETFQIIFTQTCKDGYIEIIQILLKHSYNQKKYNILKLKRIHEIGLIIAKSRNKIELIRILEESLKQ